MQLYREDAAKHYISEKSDSRVVLIWLDMGRKKTSLAGEVHY